MGIVERYLEYAEAFEKTFVDDDWSRVGACFTADAVYRPGGTEASDVAGREAVCARLKDSLDSFDRRFDRRQVRLLTAPRQEGTRVIVEWEARYSKQGVPEVAFTGTETATFEGEQIAMLVDTFEPGSLVSLQAWMQEHGAMLMIGDAAAGGVESDDTGDGGDSDAG